MLWIFSQQKHVARYISNRRKKKMASISFTYDSTNLIFNLPLANAQIHVLHGTCIDSLAIFEIIQNVHHFVIDFVNFTGDVATNARFVDQKWNVVSCANDKWHFCCCRCLAPIFGKSIG